MRKAGPETAKMCQTRGPVPGSMGDPGQLSSLPSPSLMCLCENYQVLSIFKVTQHLAALTESLSHKKTGNTDQKRRARVVLIAQASQTHLMECVLAGGKPYSVPERLAWNATAR